MAILPGSPPIEVTVRRSGRARRMSLRVSRLDGRVTLTLPPRTSLHEGMSFLREREGWLRGHLAQVGAAARPEFGGEIPFRGQPVTLTPAKVRAPRIEGEALLLPEDPGRLEARVLAFLRTEARNHLAGASDRYAGLLGRRYGRITLRDTRSRWGSCSVQGDLMYSWRLIMAPPEVLDYVAAHEVAHLAEMNHSPAFWAVVERLYPGHADCRTWLRRHGDSLHRLRFGGGGGD
ncbi:MAG: M48 family metallopeptidase [Rubellimicrobium sp.]|nr:M48 family metallopeptidase [Rubellimicrobium sp.]